MVLAQDPVTRSHGWSACVRIRPWLLWIRNHKCLSILTWLETGLLPMNSESYFVSVSIHAWDSVWWMLALRLIFPLHRLRNLFQVVPGSAGNHSAVIHLFLVLLNTLHTGPKAQLMQTSTSLLNLVVLHWVIIAEGMARYLAIFMRLKFIEP